MILNKLHYQIGNQQNINIINTQIITLQSNIYFLTENVTKSHFSITK